MIRTGYSLPDPPPQPTCPWWEKDNMAASQARMDIAYFHGPGGLDNFYDQAESWIQTQTTKRANSPDPKNYKADPFQMSIPRRQIAAYGPKLPGSDYGAALSDAFAPPDASIQMPELPPYVDPGPVGGPGFKMATPPDVKNEQMLSAIMKALMSVAADVAAIKAAQGK